MDRFYALVRQIGRFWIWFFFDAVEVRHRERVPPTGPVLLCINHPNNLIDSLLVGAVLSRKVHYLATASLFRNRLVGRFLAQAGAIPVYRRQDALDSAERNVETFAACRRALEAGRLVAIYPEGTTHSEARVQRIKTGAARIALEYASAHERPALAVIPVGLTFAARKAFRGRVRVAFGAPIPLHAHVDRSRLDPEGAVEALTDAIQAAMTEQIVHIDRVDTLELVRQIEALYRDDLVRSLRAERGLSPGEVDPFRLTQTLADAVTHFRTHDPARVVVLARRLARYQASLGAYRLRDEAVRGRARDPSDSRLRASWQALAGLPVFVYGAMVNGLPYLLPRWLARRMARKETDYATTRLLASVVAFPVFWGLETWLVWRAGGPGWATLFAGSLPVSGLLAHRYLAGVGRLEHRLRFAWLALRRHHTASRLLAERQGIVAELERARVEYLATRRDAPQPIGDRS
jgi:1-acyl-sn-glycerol-3-phosphate acyltransferase